MNAIIQEQIIIESDIIIENAWRTIRGRAINIGGSGGGTAGRQIPALKSMDGIERDHVERLNNFRKAVEKNHKLKSGGASKAEIKVSDAKVKTTKSSAWQLAGADEISIIEESKGKKCIVNAGITGAKEYSIWDKPPKSENRMTISGSYDLKRADNSSAKVNLKRASLNDIREAESEWGKDFVFREEFKERAFGRRTRENIFAARTSDGELVSLVSTSQSSKRVKVEYLEVSPKHRGKDSRRIKGVGSSVLASIASKTSGNREFFLEATDSSSKFYEKIGMTKTEGTFTMGMYYKFSNAEAKEFARKMK